MSGNNKAERYYKLSREARHEWAAENFPVDLSNPSNSFKIPTGTYGSQDFTIDVKQDGTWVVPKEAYPDDVLAFMLGSLKNKPGIDPVIIAKFKDIIQRFDESACSVHGYEDSPEEKNYDWQPLH